jgi:thioredoxin reductase
MDAMLVPPAGARPPSCDPPVRVLPPADLVGIRGAARLQQVELRRNGNVVDLSADTLVYAVGVTPNTHWLKGSGIGLNGCGAVEIDERCRTSVPRVFAIGTATSPSIDHVHSIDMGIAAARALGGGHR